ncbi:MAG TPA: M3 family metallopeptidase, partial [Candidatus Saccharimonadales bacterium]|nr:M3 family metallopeptidase [Candidatus Saccharimonadales bacterium]
MALTTGSATAAELTERNRARLATAAGLLDQIHRASAPFTEVNVLRPYNDLSTALAEAGAETSLLGEVHPDAAVREASDAIVRELSELRTRIGQDRPLYDAISALDRTALDPSAGRVVELTLRDMRRSGTLLDGDTQARVRAVRAELVQIEQEFSRNIRDDVREIALAPEQLAGLPTDYIGGHPVDADGKVHITTNYPDLIPFLTYASDGAARKALAVANNTRAVPRNIEVLGAMLRKREELSGLLGYANWAEYVTEDKMSGSAGAVRDFIERARDACAESAAAEYEDLLAAKRTDDPAATFLGSWDTAYYTERVKAERYRFDGRELRPYFEYRAVRQAILDLASELFGLTFTPVDVALWHPSVETFEVTVDGSAMGRISLDMFPRDGKFNHAACFTFIPGIGGKRKQHSVLVCNFPDPAAQQGPALMQHSEVVTFFHEFGHLVHNIVRGDIPWVRLGGVAEWDFVEAPSQLLEEWIFDHSVLRRFAKHVESGEVIPEGLVTRLREARDFGRATGVQRQLMLAALALRLHDRPADGLDSTALVFETAREFSPIVMPEGTAFQAAFGHLEGYTALYYTYIWSLVISKDLRSAFTAGL